MKYQNLLIVLTFFVVVAAVYSQDEDEEGQFYCGRRLARTLALMCDNGLLVKRSETMYNSLMPQRERPYGWPWITHHRARSMQRGKRQAASECCDKPCTLDELLSYCG